MNKSLIHPEKSKKSLKIKLSFKINFWATVNKNRVFWTDVPDVTLQTEKEISLHLHLQRSMPETLFGTLTNLLNSVQKSFSVRTLIKQKLVK